MSPPSTTTAVFSVDNASVLSSVYPEAVITAASVTLPLRDPFETGCCITVTMKPLDNIEVRAECKGEGRRMALNFGGYLLRSLKDDFAVAACETRDDYFELVVRVLGNADEQARDFFEELASENKRGVADIGEGAEESSGVTSLDPPRRPLTDTWPTIGVFYSHHIIAKSKITLIKTLSRSLSLTGILLKGWPGAIVVEGDEASVDEFAAEMKQLNWMRFLERGRVNAEEGRGAMFDGFVVLEEVKEFTALVRSISDEAIGKEILAYTFDL